MADTLVEEVDTSPSLQELAEENRWLHANQELLEENMAQVILSLDDLGQRKLGADFDTEEIPLDTVKNKSKTTRSQLALNPLAKRAVAVRTAYVWGNGVEFQGLEDTPFWESSTNQKYLLSPQALGEMEAALATDGNFFVLATKARGRGTAKIVRVPMAQITGTVSDPDNDEDVWYYKREWTEKTFNNATGEPVETHRTEYFPATDYDPKVNGRPTRIAGHKVNYSSAISHHAVNKQLGWKWGLGDMAAVIFWIGAHKEFLEDCKNMVKAYSRYAFKVTAPAAKNVQAVSARVKQAPTVDPRTGQSNDVGGTAVMGQGANLQAVRAGGSVDFKAGVPMAGYIAAGMEIPLTELLADAGEANRSSAETLSSSTLKAMISRQQAHVAFYKRLFKYLGLKVSIKFPPIEKELVYRQIQAIASAMPLNVLSAKEMRKMLIQAFELDADSDVLPTEEELGLMLASNTSAAKEAAAAEKAALTAGPKKADTDNPSNGDNGYRDDAGSHSYTHGKD